MKKEIKIIICHTSKPFHLLLLPYTTYKLLAYSRLKVEIPTNSYILSIIFSPPFLHPQIMVLHRYSNPSSIVSPKHNLQNTSFDLNPFLFSNLILNCISSRIIQLLVKFFSGLRNTQFRIHVRVINLSNLKESRETELDDSEIAMILLQSE